VTTATKVENRRDGSRSVRNRLPFYPDRFRFFRENTKTGPETGRDETGLGSKTGRQFFRPYLQNTVFDRDNPVFILFTAYPG
jgi:hypothetical protein